MVAYQFALLDITVRFCSPQPKGSEIMMLINNMSYLRTVWAIIMSGEFYIFK